MRCGGGTNRKSLLLQRRITTKNAAGSVLFLRRRPCVLVSLARWERRMMMTTTRLSHCHGAARPRSPIGYHIIAFGVSGRISMQRLRIRQTIPNYTCTLGMSLLCCYGCETLCAFYISACCRNCGAGGGCDDSRMMPLYRSKSLHCGTRAADAAADTDCCWQDCVASATVGAALDSSSQRRTLDYLRLPLALLFALTKGGTTNDYYTSLLPAA